MKICHVITRLIRGGAQENTVYTALGQAKLGHDVTLIHGPELNGENPFPNFPKEIKKIVLPELVRALAPVKDYQAYQALKKHFLAKHYDIIHTHSSKAGILGRLAAEGCGAKIVHTIHGLAFDNYESSWRNSLYIAAEKRAAKNCDAIISVCDTMTKQALAAGIGRPEIYHTVWSGSDLEAFQAVKKERKENNSPNLKLVAVTRLFPKKGAEELLAALEKTPETVSLFIVGDGPLRAKLEKQAEEKLKGRVVFHGGANPSEIPALLKEGDVLVHASKREGLARVLVQALAEGIPVVTTNAGGAAEIVQNGVNGYLVPIGDTNALGSVLARLATDSQALAEIKKGATACDLSRFSLEAMVTGTMEVYKKLF